MKKFFSALCAALLASFALLAFSSGVMPTFAKDKVKKVDSAKKSEAPAITNAEIQKRIDELKAKNAELAAKHSAVIAAHAGDAAKAAKINEKTTEAIAKHDALIAYYEWLLQN